MPIYSFICDTADKGCGCSFEQQASMAQSSSLQPKCPSCKCSKPVRRNYQAEGAIVFGPTISLGSQMDRNSNLSLDERTHVHTKNNAYRDQEYTGPLPEGATVMEKDSSGNRIVSTKVSNIDRKKKHASQT